MIREQLYLIRKVFSLKRLVNAKKAYMSYYVSLLLKRPVVWGYPPTVMFEPTNICNLKCPLCPSGNDSLTRKKGYLTFDLFKKTIDEIHLHTAMVILWNQGEPFLNKDFLEMINYAHQKRMFTLTSTNGNIMPDAEEIVKSGLDSIIFSLDGSTQETYNKYRINGDLSEVLKNVRALVEAKKKLNSKTPFIKWQFIVLKHNEHEVEDIKRMAKEIGADGLELKTAQIYHKDDIDNFLPQNPKYRRYKISGTDFELKFGVKNRCRRIWTQPVVNWDGQIAPCCYDKDIEYPIGNIGQNTFKKIWTSPKFNNMRQLILKNRKSIFICNNCGEGVSLKISSKEV